MKTTTLKSHDASSNRRIKRELVMDALIKQRPNGKLVFFYSKKNTNLLIHCFALT